MLARAKGGFRLILNYFSFAISASIFGPFLLKEKKPDIIFVFEPSPVTVGLPAVILGHIKNVPIVFWALDLWPETLSAVGVIHSQRIINLVGHLVRFIYTRCTLVLGQSKGFLNSISKYCDKKEKVRYFPSWAEDIFTTEKTKLAPEVVFQPDIFNIMFAGNIGESQDMPAVLEAASFLRENKHIRWLIVGDGRKFDWLQKEIKNRNLTDTIILLGRFPVDRMPSFYAHADALLVCLKKGPAFSMTIPGKLQSYLFSGTPVLAMLDGEGAAIVEEAKAGLACPAGDSRSLAENVLKMTIMPKEELKIFGSNGRAYAQKEFGRNQLMQKMENLLKEAIQLFHIENKSKSNI